MAKTLGTAGGRVRVLGPTTTVKLAERMLGASRVLAAGLPAGLNSPIAWDMLMALHVAEERAHYLTRDTLEPATCLPAETRHRWIQLLIHHGLIECNGDFLALSVSGYTTLVDMLEDVYAAQRRLD